MRVSVVLISPYCFLSIQKEYHPLLSYCMLVLQQYKEEYDDHRSISILTQLRRTFCPTAGWFYKSMQKNMTIIGQRVTHDIHTYVEMLYSYFFDWHVRGTLSWSLSVAILRCICAIPHPLSNHDVYVLLFFPYLYNRRWCCVDLYIFFHLIWREEVQGHGCQHSKFLDFYCLP